MRLKTVVGMAAAMTLLSAQQATATDAAGTYVVSGCNVLDPVTPINSWSVAMTGVPTGLGGEVVAEMVCGQGPGMTVKLGYQRSVPAGSSVALTFSAPPDTQITAFSLWRSASGSTGTAAYSLRGDTGLNYEWSPDIQGWTIGYHVDDGLVRRSSVALSSLRFGLDCEVPPKGCDPVSSATIGHFEITLADGIAPALDGSPSGSLLEDPASGGEKHLNVGYLDRGGGVSSATLIIDGVARDTQKPCDLLPDTKVPCPLHGHLQFTIDDGSLGPGAHEVAVAVTDIARNTTTFGPYLIGSTAPVPAPPEIGATTVPDAVLTVLGKRTRRARYGATLVLHGILHRPGGEPIGGAQVAMRTRVLGGGARLPAAGSTTGPDGSFAVRLGKGPSREIQLSYGSASQSIRVNVPAPIRLKTDKAAARNGKSIRFLGSVPGAGDATTRVELQAWAEGHWIPFKTTELRHGGFTATYRFTQTFSTNRYRFRAVIHSDAHFPYAAGTSRVVKVLVRP